MYTKDIKVKILGDRVLRCGKRDIILAKIHTKEDKGKFCSIRVYCQPFYKSTGTNSGKKDCWLPFSGILCVYGNPVWFVKDKYSVKDEDGNKTDLNRYGTQELKEVSEILGKMSIPIGEETPAMEINKWLLYEEGNIGEDLSYMQQTFGNGERSVTPPNS